MCFDQDNRKKLDHGRALRGDAPTPFGEQLARAAQEVTGMADVRRPTAREVAEAHVKHLRHQADQLEALMRAMPAELPYEADLALRALIVKGSPA